MSRYRDVVNELTASDYIIKELKSRIEAYEKKAGYAHFVLKNGKEISHKFADINDAMKIVSFLNDAELVETYLFETK